MFKIAIVTILNLLLLPFESQAEVFVRCSQYFAEKEAELPDGFINIYDVSRSQQQHQETLPLYTTPAPPKPPSGNPYISIAHNRIENSKEWMADYLAGNREASEAIREITLKGRRSVRNNKVHEKTLETFREIHNLTRAQIHSLSARQLIEIFTLHANYNLLMPTRFTHWFHGALNNSIATWGPGHFRNFAVARKFSPQEFPNYVLRNLNRRILSEFNNWKTETKMIVLTSELIHRNFWTVRDIKFLLESTADSMVSARKTFKIQSNKELLRALIYLRSQNPGIFSFEIVRIEGLIEGQLNSMGWSLSDGGTSGALNAQHRLPPLFRKLENEIDKEFPNQTKKIEHFDANKQGFFDPVDLYYPGLRLVVEWDGSIHYFRTFKEDGTIDYSVFVLRPWDVIKDSSLKKLGISVFRVSEEINLLIGLVPVKDLIRDQNPNTWDY